MFKSLPNKSAPFVSCLAILILGIYSYYINRFVSCNVFVIVWELSILAGLCVDKTRESICMFLHNAKNCTINCYLGAKIGVSLGLFLALVALAFGNIFSSRTQLDLYASGKYNTKIMKDWAQEVKQVVPKNTYGVGLGVDVIYSLLGWDSGYNIIDYPNITGRPDMEAYLLDTFRKQSAVFVDSEFLQHYNINKEDYLVEHTFSFGNRTYFFLAKDI